MNAANDSNHPGQYKPDGCPPSRLGEGRGPLIIAAREPSNLYRFTRGLLAGAGFVALVLACYQLGGM